MIKVLGIDPGLSQSAVVGWDGLSIERIGIIENNLLLSRLKTFSKFHVAIETMQCFGMAVGQSVLDTAIWVGRFIQECERWKILWSTVFRKDIKLHLCHTTRAKDSNVRQALVNRFGEKGTKKNPGLTYGLKGDMWSAFAISVYQFDMNEQRE